MNSNKVISNKNIIGKSWLLNDELHIAKVQYDFQCVYSYGTACDELAIDSYFRNCSTCIDLDLIFEHAFFSIETLKAKYRMSLAFVVLFDDAKEKSMYAAQLHR